MIDFSKLSRARSAAEREVDEQRRIAQEIAADLARREERSSKSVVLKLTSDAEFRHTMSGDRIIFLRGGDGRGRPTTAHWYAPDHFGAEAVNALFHQFVGGATVRVDGYWNAREVAAVKLRIRRPVHRDRRPPQNALTFPPAERAWPLSAPNPFCSEKPMKNRARLSTMNVALRKPMSLAEFLEWEEQQPLRYEFDGVAAEAMTGGTAGHADIQRNLAISIGARTPRQTVQVLRQRSQDSGRGRPYPLSRRDRGLHPCRADRHDCS